VERERRACAGGVEGSETSVIMVGVNEHRLAVSTARPEVIEQPWGWCAEAAE
jgi:hypothetical protein